MSDWGSTHDTLGAANGGLDLEMPSGTFLNRYKLLALLKEGKVTQKTLEDKERRILRVAVRFGWLDRPQRDATIPRYNPQGRTVALQTAREGIVLLKNSQNLLPLNREKVKTIALIGTNAHPAVPLGGGSATIIPFHAVSLLEGVGTLLGSGNTLQFARGIPTLSDAANATLFSTAPMGGQPGLNVEVFNNTNLSGAPTSKRVDPHIVLGTPRNIHLLFIGEAPADQMSAGAPSKPGSTRWTGYYTPKSAGTYDIFVQQGGASGYRLYVDDKLVADSWDMSKAIVEQVSLPLTATPHKVIVEHHSGGSFSGPLLRVGIVRQGEWVSKAVTEMARKADAVVISVGFDPTTETEGWDRTFQLPPGQDELIQKISAKNKNTVVVLNAGGSVDMNRWLERVPSVLHTWYPGQEGGTAVAEVLFGEVNPSRHSPITFERRWEDNPVHKSYYPEMGTNRVPYKEGIFVGYRGYEKAGTKPLFPFGHGLSYTNFRYSNLVISPPPSSSGDSAQVRYEVSFDVTHTGKRTGATVAQVYVADSHAPVPRPLKELKGFSKVSLKPGETRKITVPLEARSLAYYDVKGKQWRAEAGVFEILVGDSSEQIALRGKLTLSATIEAK